MLGNGQKGGLNVGAVVILPDGFKLAPKNRLNDELKAKTKGVYITPYSPTKENILVVGNSKPTKKKIEKAKELKIKIFSENEWYELLNI